MQNPAQGTSNLPAMGSRPRTVAMLLPQSSNLYLLDLVEMTEPLLIDTTSGDANLFDLSWSPAGRRLLYSQSQYIGPTLPGASVSRPAGPLVLLDTDKISRAIANYPNFFIVRWIDERRFLVSRLGGFDLLDTEGTLLTSQPRTGPWQVVPSPDKRWLAWNRELEGDAAELYAYRVSTGETQVVSTDFSGLIAPLWLPQGQRLGYLTHATNGVELTITNLISGKSYTVGYSADTDDCNPTAARGPSNEVLWYRCAEGVYVSRIAADGAITEKRLFDERANIYVSANHQIALLEPIAVNPANSLQPNRMIYDFLEDRLIELADTEGSLWFEFLQ